MFNTLTVLDWFAHASALAAKPIINTSSIVDGAAFLVRPIRGNLPFIMITYRSDKIFYLAGVTALGKLASDHELTYVMVCLGRSVARKVAHILTVLFGFPLKLKVFALRVMSLIFVSNVSVVAI